MNSERSIDVYSDWLGITETSRPLDYYQLLRLSRFEDDQDRVRRHYRKMHHHARKYATGVFSEESQQLLNELARAMLCLTDLRRKSEYDESLGRKQVSGQKKKNLQNILIDGGLLNHQQVSVAEQYATAVGLPLRDAICQKEFLEHSVVMQAYAQAEGLPFLELSDVTIDEDLLPKISTLMARTHSVVPVMVENGQLLLASPNPLDLQMEEDLKLRLGMPVRMVLCTSNDVNRLINKYYSREKADAEIVQRSDDAGEVKEPEGFAKIWTKIKQWVEKHNKK